MQSRQPNERETTKRRSSKRWTLADAKAAALLGAALVPLGAADSLAAAKAQVKVESTPSGALVSVSSSDGKSGSLAMTIAGVTPFEKVFAFPKQGALTLTLEKRGHAPRQLQIDPGSKDVHATLEKVVLGDQGEIANHALPRSGTLKVVPPELEVIKRGFSSEGVEAEASRTAETALQSVAQALLAASFRVEAIAATDDTRAPLKALWRDARTAMQLADPIRLPYLERPLRLETSSARKAAATLGGAEPHTLLLLVAGKQVRDTGGMKLGQLAVMSAGTACSYASGYARAMEHGDSFFVYSVHTPDFTSGLTLRASLIDAATGEVLWVNRGNWNAVRFDKWEAVSKVVRELLAGLL